MTTAEDRDLWERDEEVIRRQAAEAHEQARPATHSPADAEKVSQDVGEVERARVARYAEAIRSVVIAHDEQLRDLLDAILPVADSELASVVAENERLRAEVGRETEAHRADLLADIEDGLDASDALIEALSGRDAAEAEVERLRVRLAKVEALLSLRESNNVRDEDGFVVVRVDDVRAMTAEIDHRCESDGNGACKHCGADEPPPWPTRAALADAPTEQRGGEPASPDAAGPLVPPLESSANWGDSR